MGATPGELSISSAMSSGQAETVRQSPTLGNWLCLLQEGRNQTTEHEFLGARKKKKKLLWAFFLRVVMKHVEPLGQHVPHPL